MGDADVIPGYPGYYRRYYYEPNYYDDYYRWHQCGVALTALALSIGWLFTRWEAFQKSVPLSRPGASLHSGLKNASQNSPEVSVFETLLDCNTRRRVLRTAFINFGRDYPNQTFAGFIAAGSKMATD